MRLPFTPLAAQDLAAIANYIRVRNPGAALHVRANILHSLQNLVLFPQVGRAQAVEGVRKLVTRKYRYLIYYAIDYYAIDEAGEEIVILTIQHPARERAHEDA
jgi:toxin ParE1/3/4